MNADRDYQRMAPQHSRKRSHREISTSESHHRPPWLEQGESSGSHRTYSAGRPVQLPPLPSMRYPGDGYDFRRPIMSTDPPRPTPPPARAPPPGDVIDLTDEPDSLPNNSPRHEHHRHRPRNRTSRPPRFGRDIMSDVVDLESEPSGSNHHRQASSPEVQFIGSSTRPPEPTGPARTGVAATRQRPPFLFAAGNGFADMLRRFRRGMPSPHEDMLRQEVAMRTRHLAHSIPHRAVTPFWIGDAPGEGIDLTIDFGDEDLPVELDYRATGFGPRSNAPTYNPPSPPPQGFTRNIKEDEVVVCPNCDHELGTGDEIRRQIWVAKACGHVYCGTCTKHRAISRSKKNDTGTPPVTKPFSKCVVSECGRPVSQPKAMLQIYL